jgi:FkbM family methyltransferase
VSAIAIDTSFINGNGKLPELFLEMQKLESPDFCIEVGAYEAEFSFAMSDKFGVRSVAFEANPAIFQKYTTTESLHVFYKDTAGYSNTNLVEYVNLAIADYSGEAIMNVMQYKDYPNNSIMQSTRWIPTESFSVPCTSLDFYFKDIEFKNAVLWIDAEGANKQVLLGAKETLKRCDSIFIETEETRNWEDCWPMAETIDFLWEHGFQELERESVYDYHKNHILVKKEIK